MEDWHETVENGAHEFRQLWRRMRHDAEDHEAGRSGRVGLRPSPMGSASSSVYKRNARVIYSADSTPFIIRD